MTKEKLLELFSMYEDWIREELGGDDIRLQDHQYHELDEVTDSERLDHLAYMCRTAREFMNADRIDKAMRWLGFIQGTLWALKRRSLYELKEDSMP